MKKLLLSILTAVVMATFVSPCEGGALFTRMGEVRIDNIRLGRTFSMSEALNMPFKVTNASAFRTELKMEIIIPVLEDKDLRPGYEPLPDASWVKLSRDFFILEPGAEAVTDVVFTVPKKKEYFGKKYQFYIVSRITRGITNVNVAVVSRFLLNVITKEGMKMLRGKKPPARMEPVANLNFSLLPWEVFLKGAKPGRLIDILKETGNQLKIVNPNDQELKFLLKCMTVRKAGVSLKRGYEDCPAPSFLNFSETEFVVPPNSIKKVKMFLKFPKHDEYFGKRYMFIIVLENLGQEIKGKVYSRLYVTTEAKH